MPDPISSSVPPANFSYDPHSDDVGLMSRAEGPGRVPAPPPASPAPTASAAEPPVASSPAVPQLISSVPSAPVVLPPQSPSPPPSTANNNAQRASERPEVSPYVAFGTTASGDSAYAGGALLLGRDPQSGTTVEVLSASAQLGAQNELQFGLQRVSGGRGPLSGSVETFTARVQAGVHNDDGSTGLNLGAGVSAIGVEGTVGGATSLTYGVSAGPSVAASIGLRDADGDGNRELCGRVSFGPVTVGACVESPL